MQRISFRIPAETREDVLDGVLPLLPAGIVERPVATGEVEISSVRRGAARTRRCGRRRRRELEELSARTSRRLARAPAPVRRRRGADLGPARRALAAGPAGARGLLEVVIERGGSGFGSGSHPTTQMCLGLLLELEPAGGAADFGCGVGTLAIAAAKLGWAPVSGLDREGPAIEEAHLNARRNGVNAEFAHADVATAELPIRELLMANAPPPVHERLAAAVTPQVRHVIVSGIVEGELAPVREAYAAAGLLPRRGMAADSWVAVLLGREDG